MKKKFERTKKLFILMCAVFATVSCERTKPDASFGYDLISHGDYVICNTVRYSFGTADEENVWTLQRPDGTTTTSYLHAPKFTCYKNGIYHLSHTAQNKAGIDYAKETFSIYDINNGSNGGGGGTSPTATGLTIKWLRLEKIMMKDTDGSSWDTGIFGGADPDIKFQIQNSSNSTSYYTSSTKNNVSESDLPVTWYDVNTTIETGKEYRIRFIDADDGIDSDDIMANCIFMTTSSYITPGITTYTWKSIDGEIKFTIGLSWLYAKGNNEFSSGIPDNIIFDNKVEPSYPIK